MRGPVSPRLGAPFFPGRLMPACSAAAPIVIFVLLLCVAWLQPACKRRQPYQMEGGLDAWRVSVSRRERQASRPPARPDMMAATECVKLFQGTCECATSCAHHHISILGGVGYAHTFGGHARGDGASGGCSCACACFLVTLKRPSPSTPAVSAAPRTSNVCLRPCRLHC